MAKKDKIPRTPFNKGEKLLPIPNDEQQLKGYIKGIETAIKVWGQGTMTYGHLSEYLSEAQFKLEKFNKNGNSKIKI